MEKNISKFLKFTTKNFKNLRKTLQELKKEREEQNRFVPHAPKEAAKEDPQELVLLFSMANVAKATLVVLGVILLSQFLAEIGHIILLLFIAVFFASALNPTVNALEKRKVPRWLSMMGMLFILLLILGFFISQLIPLIATQLIELAKTLNVLMDKMSQGPITLPFGKSLEPLLNQFLGQIDKAAVLHQIKQALESAASQLESFAGNTFGAIKTVFNGVVNFVLVLVLTFFLVINDKEVNGFFISLFPYRHGAYIAEKIHTVQQKVGFWLQGQLILMLAIFGCSLIGLLIMGVPNALTLSMMFGMGELIPVVGPLAAGIPTVLVAFNQSPWLAIWVIGFILILQQAEGHILVPLVMRKAVGLSPIVVILAMITGLETLGVVGMILAVPVASTLSIFVKEYTDKEK